MKRRDAIAIVFLGVVVAVAGYKSRLSPMPAATMTRAETAPDGEEPARLPIELPIELLAKLKAAMPAGGRNLFEFVKSPPTLPDNRAAIAVERPTARGDSVAASTTPQAAPQSSPLKFYGYVSRRAHVIRGFFCDGSAIYIKAEGEVIAGRYRVIRIAENSVVIEDLSRKQRETLALSEDAVIS